MYPTTSTGVTPDRNPYVINPPIARLFAFLHQHAVESGEPMFRVSNRQLARNIACSPGLLPSLLRRLSKDGHIEYDADSSQVIVYCNHPDCTTDHADCSDDSVYCDQSVDQHDHAIDHEGEAPISALAAAPCQFHGDQPRDRVKNACKEDHDSKHSSSSSMAHAGDSAAAVARAMRADGADQKIIEAALRHRSDRDLAEYNRQKAVAQRRPDVRDWRRFIFGLWARGEDVVDIASRPQTFSPTAVDHHTSRHGSRRPFARHDDLLQARSITAADEAQSRSFGQMARNIAPVDASEIEIQELALAIESGREAAAALSALYNGRGAA